MAAIAGHRLALDPMGKCSNPFFSETINQTEIQTRRECSLDGSLQSLAFFCSDIKWKMAATAGLNLTLDPMGKCV